MTEEQQVSSSVIKQKSLFKIRDFYDFVYNLVSSQGFDIFEKEFGRDGGSFVFEWDCTREVDDYVRFKIWIKCNIDSLGPVRVKREGVSEDVDKAEVKFRIKGKIITDWQNRWESKPLIKFLKGVYDKYLYKPTFDERRKALVDKTYLIENEVKSFFDLPRFM